MVFVLQVIKQFSQILQVEELDLFVVKLIILLLPFILLVFTYSVTQENTVPM